MVIFFLYCVAILLAEFDCKLILHSILFDKDGTGKNHNCSFSSQNKSIFSIVKNIFFFLIQYFFMTGISAIKELIKGTKETCLFTLYNSEFNSEIALIRHYYKSVHFFVEQYQQNCNTTQKLEHLSNSYFKPQPYCQAKEAEKKLRYRGVCLFSTRHCKIVQKSYSKDKKILHVTTIQG